MDIESLKPLLSLVLWGALFFFLMRVGCGAHMGGGHGRHGADRDEGEQTDPVCGMNVTAGSAKAATVHKGRTYYFCSTSCRDKFEAALDKYVTDPGSGGRHHG